VRVSIEPEPLGPVGALRAAADLLDDSFLYVLGDVLPPTGPDLWAEMAGSAERAGTDAVMAVAPTSAGRDRGNVELGDVRVTRYDKASQYPYIDRGVRFLRRRVLALHPGSGDTEFFGSLVASDGLAHLLVDEPIVEVGTPESWEHACAVLASADPSTQGAGRP
jgi:NDP-sugar pyrophosphorylase family protein